MGSKSSASRPLQFVALAVALGLIGLLLPVWSSFGDGGAADKQIAFVRGGDIYVMDEGGEAPGNIPLIANANHPTWNPDQTQIAYVATVGKGKNSSDALFVRDVNGDGTVGPPTQLTTGINVGGPEWSPYGQWIVFHSTYTGNSELYLVPMGPGQSYPLGPNDLRITDTPEAHEGWATWSPNADVIAFTRGSADGSGIYVISRPDPGSPIGIEAETQLVEQVGVDFDAEWSCQPSGERSRVAFTASGDIWVSEIPHDGSGYVDLSGAPYAPVQVTTNPELDSWPSWSPDGKALAYQGTDSRRRRDIYKMPTLVQNGAINPNAEAGRIQLTADRQDEGRTAWNR